MKTNLKNIRTIAAMLLSVIAFSCSKIDSPTTSQAKEVEIDATSKTTWAYFSLSKGEVIGTGEEGETDNATWAARSDWDIAVCRYNIRTNSGTSSSVESKGGTYTSDKTFNELTALPSETVFAADTVVASSGMSGEKSVSESTATVILFKQNADGSKVMPPVYLKAPVYVFRSADGKNFYKVEFTQYQDENKVTGKVKFNYETIF